MCSSAFTPPLFDADDGSIDEVVMLFLNGRKAGDPTPANVITNVNPFSLEPWDFPEGMWYLYNYNNYQSCTEWRNIKVTRIGYWKPMDEITIFHDAATVGSKITLEFYIGLEPFGDRTGWKMQEYHRDQKSFHESNFSQWSYLQDYQFMCRVFLQNEKTDEEQHNPSSSIALEDQNSFSPSDPHAYLGFPRDDYLELNDLYDPDSASSSSNNSSIISVHSIEYFNSEELLQYLGSASSSQNMQEKPVNVVINPSQPPDSVYSMKRFRS